MSASPWQLVNSPERLRGNRRHLGDRRSGSIAFTESPRPGLVRDVPARLLPLPSEVSRAEDDLVSQFWNNFEELKDPWTTLCHSFGEFCRTEHDLVSQFWTAGTCARSLGRLLKTCWWKRLLSWPWCAVRRRSPRSSGWTTIFLAVDHIYNNITCSWSDLQQYSLQLIRFTTIFLTIDQIGQQYSFYLIRLDNNIPCNWSAWTTIFLAIDLAGQQYSLQLIRLDNNILCNWSGPTIFFLSDQIGQ